MFVFLKKVLLIYYYYNFFFKLHFSDRCSATDDTEVPTTFQSFPSFLLIQ